MKVYLSFIIFFLSFGNFCFAQQSVLFVGGDSLFANKVTLLDSTQEISIELLESGKTKIFSTDEIFSITDNKGKETILFKPFKEDNLDFTIANMRLFIKGEQYSDKHSAWFAGMLSLGVGFAAPILMANKLNPFYSPIPVALGTAFIGMTSPSKRRAKRLYPKLSSDPYFLEGYTMNGKARRINSSIRGGLIGFILGWVVAISASSAK